VRAFRLFDIKFLDGSFREIKAELDKGGLMVVPAAPALATIDADSRYFDALKESDFAILDSGLLCLGLRLMKGYKVQKLSGLAFLRQFINSLDKQESDQVFLIDPSAKESALNKELFDNVGIDIRENQYIAPMYDANEIVDTVLLEILKAKKPRYVVMNLGGGVQERLGAYLKSHLESTYRPSIICTGAAIAFMTHAQASIPKVFDDLYLGWLVRCISDPRRFVPRYFSGFRLIAMLRKTKFQVEL